MQLEKCSDQAVSSAHDKPTSSYTFLASNCTASNRWRSRISRSSKIKKHRRQVTTSAYMNTDPDSVPHSLFFTFMTKYLHNLNYFGALFPCKHDLHKLNSRRIRASRYIYVHINNRNLHIFLSILNTYIFHRRAILIIWYRYLVITVNLQKLSK